MFVIVQHNQLYGIEKDTTACTPTNRLDHPPESAPGRRLDRSGDGGAPTHHPSKK
jgi:hypothetical protein